jgi:HEAT repeat protein
VQEDKRLVSSEEFSIPIDDFRELIQWFANRYNYVWETSDGQFLLFYETTWKTSPQRRGSWIVYLVPQSSRLHTLLQPRAESQQRKKNWPPDPYEGDILHALQYVPSAVQQAVEGLDDSDPRGRLEAVRDLGQMTHPTARKALVDALEHSYTDVSVYSAFVLARFRDSRAAHKLVEALRDCNNKLGEDIAKILESLKDDAALMESNPFRKDREPEDPPQGDWTWRMGADWTLQKLETAAISALLDALSDPDDYVLGTSQAILSQTSPAVLGLIEDLYHQDRNRREVAAWTLMELLDPAAVPGLIHALYDRDKNVSVKAELALRGIGTPQALEALEKQERVDQLVDSSVDQEPSEDDDPPSRAIPLAVAGIEAYEQSNGEVRVEFLDAYSPRYRRRSYHRIDQPFDELRLVIISQAEQESEPKVSVSTKDAPRRRKKRGPELGREELVYRLAMAQWAEEIKQEDPKKTWKTIAQQIGWSFGSGKSGRQHLYNARKKLERIEEDDPEGLLERVAEFRKAHDSRSK